MRSSHWEYLGFVLLGVGAAFSVTGLITFFYFQTNQGANSQYSPYSLPLLIVGVCLAATSVVAFFLSRNKRKRETSESRTPPTPPPPLPPPPPP